ncbi:MAG: TlpA family protein disulfide reductase [Methylococcaceae bacterium]|nr:TlpA family protein disulfide reductase [Methylococcaceae bacterium]MDD1608465.1 TlpA family protein disulfide reductase [Methylococcaceae bacterium]MDD1611455.1 TlpA family protein disulfide reductase [Methylococcaceae bacterium]MDD1616820.1 TlpA family protein disulfide reductase [Methylococcaceae bacterium]OYV16762.1 MAG: redoxin domain-containing protein [Methylococcaceae bacterium NSP1-2]
MKPSEIIIVVAVLALGVGLTTRFFISPADITSPAPLVAEFNLPDSSGKAHSSKEWQGKIRIINFWATWCAPCRKEIPEFIALQTKYADKNVQFIGIAIDEQQAVSDYLKTINSNYPMLIGGDAGMAMTQQFGNRIGALPYTVVVDTQGHIVHQQSGEFSTEQLVKVITPLL